MNNFRNKLQNIFELSSPEKRKEVMGTIGVWLDGKENNSKHDYRYIGHLAFRNTLIVSSVVGGAVILVVLYLTRVLQIDLRSFEPLGYDYLATEIGFVGLYAYVHAALMGCVILILSPVYFFLFLIHVNKENVDLYERDKILKYKRNRVFNAKLKRFFLFIFGIFMGWLMSGYSYMALSFVSRWGPESGLGDSYIFLLVYYGFSILCHAYGAVLLYIGMIMTYGLMADYDKYGGV